VNCIPVIASTNACNVCDVFSIVSVAGSTPMIALHLKETVDFDYIAAFSVS
jgi:hypothetical protein